MACPIPVLGRSVGLRSSIECLAVGCVIDHATTSNATRGGASSTDKVTVFDALLQIVTLEMSQRQIEADLHFQDGITP